MNAATVYEIAAGVGGAALTALCGLLLVKPKRANVYSDSAAALSNAYGLLIDKLTKDVERLDSELGLLRAERTSLQQQLTNALQENGRLKDQIHALQGQVSELASRPRPLS